MTDIEAILAKLDEIEQVFGPEQNFPRARLVAALRIALEEGWPVPYKKRKMTLHDIAEKLGVFEINTKGRTTFEDIQP